MDILAKLKEVYKKWEEIGQLLLDPDVVADMKRYVALNKEYKELQPVSEAYVSYSNILSNIENAKSILQTEKDEEFREMAKLEIEELQEKRKAWKKK